MLYSTNTICVNSGPSQNDNSLASCIKFCHTNKYTWLFYNGQDKKCGCCFDPIEEKSAPNYNIYKLQKGKINFLTSSSPSVFYILKSTLSILNVSYK